MANDESVERAWWVVDAAGLPLGRLAAEVTRLLRGKHKPTYTPHVDTGDHVIVINAAQVVLSGSKQQERIYWHTQYPGGLRSVTRGSVLAKRPERLVEKTVRGMLPHNRLGDRMYRKLKVYAGPTHPHAAQQPQPHTPKPEE
jgi:large subunit ribosomal protein L13